MNSGVVLFAIIGWITALVAFIANLVEFIVKKDYKSLLLAILMFVCALACMMNIAINTTPVIQP